MYGYVSLITRTAVTKESKQSGFGSSLTSIRSAMVEWYVRTSIHLSTERYITYIHTYIHSYIQEFDRGRAMSPDFARIFFHFSRKLSETDPGYEWHTYIHTYIHTYMYTCIEFMCFSGSSGELLLICDQSLFLLKAEVCMYVRMYACMYVFTFVALMKHYYMYGIIKILYIFFYACIGTCKTNFHWLLCNVCMYVCMYVCM